MEINEKYMIFVLKKMLNYVKQCDFHGDLVI